MIKHIKHITLGLLLTGCLVATASAELMNVAVNGTATQSSTDFGGVASRAIDGDTNGEYFDGSVSHTGFDFNAFWEVDLGAEFKLFDVVVWNRTDCCAERLNPFTIEIFDSAHMFLGAMVSTTTPSPSQSFSAGGMFDVQFIRITLAGAEREYLQLAEVQAFASSEPASLAILGLGLAGLGLSRRKFRK